MHYERTNLDRRQNRPNIQRANVQKVCRQATRAGAQPLVAAEPFLDSRLVGSARKQKLTHEAGAPLRRREVHDVGPQLVTQRPGVVGGPEVTCHAAHENQPGGSVGVSRPKKNRNRTTAGHTKDGRLLGPNRVHHRADVIHLLLRCLHGRQPI